MINQNRYEGLDIIRGLSAVFIMFYHYTSRFLEYNTSYMRNLDWNILCPWGCCAVTTFFILSGFLSYHHLFTEHKGFHAATIFLKKRFLRLYPSFILCLPISVVFAYYGFLHCKFSILEIIANISMVPGLFQMTPVDGAYWTLQVEWLFYIGIAMFLLWVPSRVRYYCIISWIFVAAIFKPIYIYCSSLTIAKAFVVFFIPSQIQTFTAGLAIYMLCLTNEKHKGYILLFLSIICQLLWQDDEHLLFFLITLVAVYLSVRYQFIQYRRLFLCRFLIWFSSISYAFYLLHQVIGHTIIDYIIRLGCDNEIILFLPFVFVTLLAWYLTRHIETIVRQFIEKIILL